MSFWPKPFTAQATQDWLERTFNSYAEFGFGRYAVILKRENRLIGDCGLLRTILDDGSNHPDKVDDLGYIIHAAEWGQGYGIETAKAIRDFVFQSLQLGNVHANMPASHHASRKVVERLGMQFIREFNNKRNRNIRTLLYRMQLAEFKVLSV